MGAPARKASVPSSSKNCFANLHILQKLARPEAVGKGSLQTERPKQGRMVQVFIRWREHARLALQKKREPGQKFADRGYRNG